MKFSKELAAVHGYLCSDGYVSRNQPHQKHKYYIIGLRNTNNFLLKDFQEKFYKIFLIKPKLIANERCHLNSKELYEKIINLGPFHSNNWKYPDLPKNLIRYWLQAFFDCEGWVTVRKGKDRRIAAETINIPNLYKIQKDLQSKFNISSTIFLRKNRNTAGIHIFGKERLIRFKKEIGLLHPEKKEKLKQAISSYLIYVWKYPKTEKEQKIFIKKLFKERAKVRKTKIIAFTSIHKDNLKTLQKIICNDYSIESHLYTSKNGQGKIYYELMIYKKRFVKELIRLRLLAKEQEEKLNFK